MSNDDFPLSQQRHITNMIEDVKDSNPQPNQQPNLNERDGVFIRPFPKRARKRYPENKECIFEPNPNLENKQNSKLEPNPLTLFSKEIANELTRYKQLVNKKTNNQKALEKLHDLALQGKVPKAMTITLNISLPQEATEEQKQMNDDIKKFETVLRDKMIIARKKVLDLTVKKLDTFIPDAMANLNDLLQNLPMEYKTQAINTIREHLYSKANTIQLSHIVTANRKAIKNKERERKIEQDHLDILAEPEPSIKAYIDKQVKKLNKKVTNTRKLTSKPKHTRKSTVSKSAPKPAKDRKKGKKPQKSGKSKSNSKPKKTGNTGSKGKSQKNRSTNKGTSSQRR